MTDSTAKCMQASLLCCRRRVSPQGLAFSVPNLGQWLRHKAGVAYNDHSHVQDLLTNPLIVPVKILKSHKVVEHEGVLDCAFHPAQPWVFTAGADGSILLFTH